MAAGLIQPSGTTQVHPVEHLGADAPCQSARVSPIDVKTTEEEDSIAMVDHAIDAGINFIESGFIFASLRKRRPALH